jgi:hypothetical protein
MKTTSKESGSTIICTLATILIVSMVGANVLMNCTTRFNSTAKQIKGWKEALYAAEAGGDLGYAECRRAVTDPGNLFSEKYGWNAVAGAATPTWTKAIPAFGEGNSLSADVTVDRFAEVNGVPYYRVRAVGKARVFGLRRVGMDDRMNATTRGDSILRKIDFNYDHFKATYGNGDALPNAPATAANGKVLQNVAKDASGALLASVSRRIELVVVPVLPFEAAIKATGSFLGPGSAGLIDSYHSQNGPYSFVANDPSSPIYGDSRNGGVSVNSANFNQGNIIYGDVTTNGGNVTYSNSKITGIIDNAVSFTIPPLAAPTLPNGAFYEPSIGSSKTITPPDVTNPDGTKKVEFWYLLSSIDGHTINALKDAAGNPIETEINIVVNGNVVGRDLVINRGATAKIYFKGSMDWKAREIINNNVDGVGLINGLTNKNGTELKKDASGNPIPGSFINSTNSSRAGHLQFYAVSRTDGGSQIVDIDPGGSPLLYGTIYAPTANVRVHGNVKLWGAIVCASFDGNGNTAFHYDKALAGVGTPTEYRIASYIEDIR